MPKRNESIGSVECPMKSCNESCDVYRYRERGESEKSVANRRFAGRLYGRCSKHGRFGGDPGEQEMQEYILANAKMKAPGAGDRQPAPAKSPALVAAPAPARKVAAPPNPPARTPATATVGGWSWPWE